MKRTTIQLHLFLVMKKGNSVPLDTRPLLVPTFTAKEVLKVLEIEKWRLQQFLNSPKYELSASGGKRGSGRGSYRLFTTEDILRLAVADQLVRDGFSYKFIAKAVQQLED